MPKHSIGETTQILAELAEGHASAVDRLLPVVYEELRSLAAAYLRQQRPDHTLQPTALVHEAYLRLVDQTSVAWQGRAHFFAVAATALRHILVDHARARRADKRGGGRQRVTLHEAAAIAEDRDIDLIALDEALTKLAALDKRKSQVVELRFFGGLTEEEVASVLGVSRTTVAEDWRMARAWLRKEMG